MCEHELLTDARTQFQHLDTRGQCWIHSHTGSNTGWTEVFSRIILVHLDLLFSSRDCCRKSFQKRAIQNLPEGECWSGYNVTISLSISMHVELIGKNPVELGSHCDQHGDLVQCDMPSLMRNGGGAMTTVCMHHWTVHWCTRPPPFPYWSTIPGTHWTVCRSARPPLFSYRSTVSSTHYTATEPICRPSSVEHAHTIIAENKTPIFYSHIRIMVIQQMTWTTEQ